MVIQKFKNTEKPKTPELNSSAMLPFIHKCWVNLQLGKGALYFIFASNLSMNVVLLSQ
jgi:hypothetical protein